jgi:hypothetical protein
MGNREIGADNPILLSIVFDTFPMLSGMDGGRV